MQCVQNFNMCVHEIFRAKLVTIYLNIISKIILCANRVCILCAEVKKQRIFLNNFENRLNNEKWQNAVISVLTNVFE